MSKANKQTKRRIILICTNYGNFVWSMTNEMDENDSAMTVSGYPKFITVAQARFTF